MLTAPTNDPPARKQQGTGRRLVPGAAPLRIILAEDDTALRTMLRECLEEAGYQVTECTDGRELQRMLLEREFDDVAAVVSDQRMPGAQGLTVLANVSAARIGAPFVLITAFGDDQIRDEARGLGAACVIDKPVDEEELVSNLKRILDLREKKSQE